jgi:hypothetical protein
VSEVITQEVEAKSIGLLEASKIIKIENQDQYLAAAEMLKNVHAVKKEVMATFKEPKQKASEAHKAICAAEKMHKEPLEEAEKLLKSKVAEWDKKVQEELEAKRIEAEKTANALEKSGEESTALEIRKDANKELKAEKVSGVSFRDKWVFEIEDSKKIPRKFMMPDEQLIRNHVEIKKDKAKIAGVKIYKKRITIMK